MHVCFNTSTPQRHKPRKRKRVQDPYPEKDLDSFWMLVAISLSLLSVDWVFSVLGRNLAKDEGQDGDW
ncbi:unnamed protein product [Linum trigynum]|uniref:Uncharacterized protein n=1 Tax=Linum trigynum TaxID=586398 RepID=A0AAV2GEL5_9ROSI